MVSIALKTQNYLANLFSGFLQDIVIAIVIVLAGFILAKILGKLISKILNAFHVDENLKKHAGMKVSVEQIAGLIVTYLVYLVTVVVALNQLHATSFIFNLVAILLIVLVVVAIILGIKDIVPNLIAGMILHKRCFLKEGDHIKMNDIEGKILHVSLFETRIETKSKDHISVPNTLLTKSEVLKYKKKEE